MCICHSASQFHNYRLKSECKNNLFGSRFTALRGVIWTIDICVGVAVVQQVCVCVCVCVSFVPSELLTFRDRTAVWARISIFVQTGHGLHPASYTMGNEPFPKVSRPRSGFVHSPPPSAQVKERVELYICFPSRPSWSVIGRTCVLRVPELLTC
jgi:hypothetical protein